MQTSYLEDIGLTGAEIKVYLALLELGKSRSGAVIEKTKLHPSVAFLTFRTLAEKGLVGRVRVGKQHLYTASDPSAVAAFAEERARRVRETLPALRALQTPQHHEGAELYEGVKGIQAIFFSIAERAKKGDVCYYFDAEVHDQAERAKLVYVPFHKKMEDAGALIKGIHRVDAKIVAEYTISANLRLTSETMPPDTTIFRDELILISWSEKPIGVVIKSKQLAQQYLALWNAVWERAK